MLPQGVAARARSGPEILPSHSESDRLAEDPPKRHRPRMPAPEGGHIWPDELDSDARCELCHLLYDEYADWS